MLNCYRVFTLILIIIMQFVFVAILQMGLLKSIVDIQNKTNYAVRDVLYNNICVKSTREENHAHQN